MHKPWKYILRFCVILRIGKMKRLFTSILLLFASVLAVCAMSSCRFTKPETFEFKLKDDGTYEVAVFNNWGQEELEIPATYKDKPVTSILPGMFNGNSTVKRIALPDTITVIDDYTFMFACIYTQENKVKRRQFFYIFLCNKNRV